MKKYSVLRRIWDNVEMTVGLSLAILLLREINQKEIFAEGIWEVFLKDFGSYSFRCGNIVVTTVQLMYGYYAIEGQKIALGCTRKSCFFDVQKVKLISTVAIIAISILFDFQKLNLEYWEKTICIAGIFLVTQSFGEIASIFQTRHTWFSMTILTITSAILGFAVGYGVISIIKGEKGESSFSVEIFKSGSPSLQRYFYCRSAVFNGNIMEIVEESGSMHIGEEVRNEKYTIKMEGGKE